MGDRKPRGKGAAMDIENDATLRANVARRWQIAKEERQAVMMTGNAHVFFARIKPGGDGGLEGFDCHGYAPTDCEIRTTDGALRSCCPLQSLRRIPNHRAMTWGGRSYVFGDARGTVMHL